MRFHSMVPCLGLLLAPPVALAQNPNNGGGVSVASGSQMNARVTPDGQGGSFVAWQDYRNGEWDIYAQHLSAAGSPLWTYNGVPVSRASSTQQNPLIIADVLGGAIVVWEDYRSGSADIYTQRLGPSGVYQWTYNGVPITLAGGEQLLPNLTSDGAGGVIVTWQDARAGQYDIYAQRVLATGTPFWTLDGVGICTQGSYQYAPVIVSDGAGGAIIVWQDSRNTYDIYAQRVSAGGLISWTSSGLPVCAATADQTAPVAISDGAGGVIAAWQDQRAGISIHTQRLNGSGVTLWATDGVALCAATNASQPTIATDGAGGAIVAWQDQRSGVDVYAQRIGTAGVPLWTGNGTVVCNAPGTQTLPVITEDGSGGAVVSWQDLRTNVTYDIFAQRIDGAGARQWFGDGVQLTDLRSSTQSNHAIALDGTGGAFVSWRDDRYASTAYDVFMQHVDAGGGLRIPDAESPRIVTIRDIPNDQGGRVKVSWTASNQDLSPFNRISEYRLWRSAPDQAVVAARRTGSLRALESIAPGTLSPGDVAVASLAGNNYFWEFLTSQISGHFLNYSYVAATTSDSTPNSNPRTAFMIEAVTASGTEWWYSDPDSGYSVDNLAPSAPMLVSAIYNDFNGVAGLSWHRNNETDMSVYRIYRGASADFAPSPSALIGTSTDTTYLDHAGAAYYYKLVAVDIHGNESVAASAQPLWTTDVSTGSSRLGLWLGRAIPNPVHDGATISFGLAVPSRVTVALYDPMGRQVRNLLHESLGAGTHSVRWDGRDDRGSSLPSGLYFLRLDADGRVLRGRVVKAE